MTAKPKPHVFLSHVREDAERVERLAADLEARGIVTWIDRHKIKPGERWEKAIEEAIRGGAFFVACFSQGYAARTRSYMNEELLIAIEEVRLRPQEASWFIPIRLDDCEIPDRRIGPELSIRSIQWLDMFPDWAKSVGHLVEAIGPSPEPDLRAPFSVFRDIDAPWCPELVVIPPGDFMMGSTEGERRWAIGQGAWHEWVESEKPQHPVSIEAPFAAGRYPVTFEEYDHFAKVTGREPPDDEGWGRGRQPVIHVSWDDAKAYVAWLKHETGKPYRLLSEAEWEYACRAGTKTPYSCGDEITPRNANYGRNVGKTTEVGSYSPNPWGLYDMHGNVWDWVEDCWNESYQGAPTNGSAWTRGDRHHRVLRGGSWYDGPGYLRSAGRSWFTSVSQSYDFGFRVAKTLSSSIRGGFADVFDDLFGDIVGGGRRRGAHSRGGDLRYNLAITLEEAFAGKQAQIRVPTTVRCGACNATGSAKGAPPGVCPSCRGAGRVRAQQGFFTIERTCPTCSGTGRVISDPCDACSGSGRVHREKTLSVTIPAGVEDGTRIRLAGEGEAGTRGGTPGDLYIFVSVPL